MLYKNKYRTKSTRLKDWDYSNNGSYFITVCTKNRMSYFGDIKNGKMYFSNMGNIAFDIWKKIPEKFNGVVLNEFVVMPNHIHGIIIVETPFMASPNGKNIIKYNNGNIDNERNILVDNCNANTINRVSTINMVINDDGGFDIKKNANK